MNGVRLLAENDSVVFDRVWFSMMEESVSVDSWVMTRRNWVMGRREKGELH